MNSGRSSLLQLDLLVDRLADDVENAAERFRANRNSDWQTRVDGVHAAADAVSRAHRHGANPVVAKVRLGFATSVLPSSIATSTAL